MAKIIRDSDNAVRKRITSKWCRPSILTILTLTGLHWQCAITNGFNLSERRELHSSAGQGGTRELRLSTVMLTLLTMLSEYEQRNQDGGW